MQYNKINNLLGWLCFFIASATYILTLEPSVSFWDCGEFISCAYRLQVSHQPGYPLFAMLGKVFSLLSFGDVTKVPYYTNMGSAIASGATIMFLFWTITAMAKKLLPAKEGESEQTRTILIMGAGLVGALAFTFTDTFWFSAVETIVFALSALCTAIVFWAILKWDAHADEPGADKWLVFIAYMIGLSIGIHLLNLLTIPAIALVVYFRRTQKVTLKSGLFALLIAIVILGLVQFGIRQWTIQLSAYFDLYFVNTLGLGFGSGSIFFFSLIIAALVAGIIYSIRKGKVLLNLALVSVAFIYFGYSSFVYIPIRATANTNLDNSHPDNAFVLNSYLNRAQYGETPLLTGPYFDAKIVDQTEGQTLYRRGEKQYEVSGKKQKYTYDHNTIFPRIYSTDGQNPLFYRQWLQMDEGQVPNFIDNLKFFFSWQSYVMYMRYFMWNFAGRINDMDGQEHLISPLGFKGYTDGDWTTGIFDGAKQLPKSVTNNVTYTPLFALPLILGLFGMWYHFKQRQRDALVITLLWFFTGLAIVLYVNQPSVQPRERDYSYVSSFYAFAIWIGIGVIALADFLRRKISPKTAAYVAIAICLLTVPVVLAKQEWKAHDRSTKMVPHDMAYNYLISCPPNAILFTYGDNDTYCVWYAQEVEGIRRDVRTVNLSLFTGDWYIRQMQREMNGAAPLPITMPYNKYKDGVRDVIYYKNAGIPGAVEVKDVFDFVTSDDPRTFATYQSGETANYLPTKDFKITIKRDDVIKNKVVPEDQYNNITDTLHWKFPVSYLLKDNLALLDIMAHNDWKRPICFTSTVGPENLVGLQPYLYKEGFVFHLMPLKPDTSIKFQDSKVNTMVMYNKLMNEFKFGKFKTAKYLDDISKTLFYPVMISTFIDLIDDLNAKGQTDLAANLIRKFDKEMPDLDVDMRVTRNKFSLAQRAFKVNETAFAIRYFNNVDNYIVDYLDYATRQMQNKSGAFSSYNIETAFDILYGMADAARNAHQSKLYDKYMAQISKYEPQFAPLFKK
ncbi:MAG: DUF2723 domain-containing protein [Bacteroidota bacterium]